jgi:hypothetical protein
MGAQENPRLSGFFGAHSETTACFGCGIERWRRCPNKNLATARVLVGGDSLIDTLNLKLYTIPRILNNYI